METRLTPQTEIARSISYLRLQFDRLAGLQEQAASGSRLNRPSDGPVDVVVVMAAHVQDQRLGAYLANIGDARSALNQSVSVLTEAGQLLSQASQAAIDGA